MDGEIERVRSCRLCWRVSSGTGKTECSRYWRGRMRLRDHGDRAAPTKVCGAMVSSCSIRPGRWWSQSLKSIGRGIRTLGRAANNTTARAENVTCEAPNVSVCVCGMSRSRAGHAVIGARHVLQGRLVDLLLVATDRPNTKIPLASMLVLPLCRSRVRPNALLAMLMLDRP